jgi:hypothetical protein
MAANRIKRLKDLVDQLERLPASPDRDRLLMEARSRAVDVDTGETPRAMPVRKPVPAPVAHERPTRHRPPGARRRVQCAPAPAPVQPAPPELELAPHASAGGSHEREQPLPMDAVLWLDDAQLPLDDSLHLPTQPRAGRRAVPPWTLGLRG